MKRLYDLIVGNGQNLGREKDLCHAIFQTIGALVVILDHSGRIVDFNHACEKVTGFLMEEIQGKCVWDVLIPPHEVETVKEIFARLTAGNFPSTAENHWLTKDGAVRLIAWNNTALINDSHVVEYVIGTGIDITNRKSIQRALQNAYEELVTANEELVATNEELIATNEELIALEEELRHQVEELQKSRESLALSNRKLNDVIEFLPDATLIVDKDKRITAWNLAMEQLTGVDKDNVLDKSSVTLAKVLYNREGPTLVDLVLSEKTMVFDNSAYDFIHKKGHTFYAEVFAPQLAGQQGKHLWIKASPLFDHKGEVIGAIESMRDITERKKAEDLMLKSRDIYLNILEEFPTMIWRSTLDAKLDYLNQSWLKFRGRKLSLELGDGWIDGVYPDDRDMCVSTYLQSFAAREPFNVEYRLRRFDGEYRWVYNVGRPIADLDGNFSGYIGTCLDITERKMTQDLLSRYQAISDRARDIILFLRPDGQIIEANKAAINSYGYSHRELLGLNIRSLRLSAEEEVHDQLSRANRDKHGILFETSHRRKDGSVFPVEVSSKAVDIGGDRFLVSIIRDITERKQAQEKLYNANRQLMDIIEFLPDPTLVIDRSHRVVAWNRAIEEMTGISKWEMMGRDDYAYAEPFYGVQRPVIVDHLLGTNIDHERYEYVHKNGIMVYAEAYAPMVYNGKGAYLWLKASPLYDGAGNLIGAIESLRDITERKRVEDALYEEKERLSVTLRSIGDGVITSNIEGRVLMINKVAEALTGWTNDEAQGKLLEDIFCIVVGSGADTIGYKWHSMLDRIGAADYGHKAMIIDRSGFEKSIAYSAAPIYDRSSKAIGVVVVFRDIAEIQRMEQEALRANKLESVSILAGGIAHDFNNILTALIGNISLAKLYSCDHNNMYMVLDEIEKASLRARDLTQQLLTFAKGGAPIKETASMEEIVKDTVDFALRGSNVRCIFSSPANLWPVDIDKGQISQVLNNLVINAQQAMPAGGLIEVVLENILVSDALRLPLKPGNYVKVIVKDHGIGIPEEHISKVFDPYFTTKQKGSGLGLATSYSIIKNHNGYIGLESQFGVGTAFYFYLPASGNQVQNARVAPVAQRGSGRILVMDDEEMVCKVAVRLLNYLGYQAETARDGAQALDLYVESKNKGRPYDVVIMDLTIPGGMGGKELIKKLLEYDPGLKAIVSSGYSNDPVMADYKSHGFAAVMLKPYKIEELAKVLNQLLA